MDPGIVSSLSGALAQSRRVDMIANNLANADTPAFKSDDLLFEEALQSAHRTDSRSDIGEQPLKDSELLSRVGDERRVVLHGGQFTDHTAGAFKQTQNPLDVAIEGNGFLEVLTPNGVRLTRAGNMALDAGGRLVTRDGFLVLGAGGAGTDPALRALTVGSDAINIDIEGNVSTSLAKGGGLLGKLSLVKVENPSALKKDGNNLFVASQEAFAKPADTGASGRAPASEVPGTLPKPNPLGSSSIAPRVHQGMLETSNVNAILEMSKLIETHRMFDQNTKLMQTFGDLNSRVSELGKY